MLREGGSAILTVAGGILPLPAQLELLIGYLEEDAGEAQARAATNQHARPDADPPAQPRKRRHPTRNTLPAQDLPKRARRSTTNCALSCSMCRVLAWISAALAAISGLPACQLRFQAGSQLLQSFRIGRQPLALRRRSGVG